MGYVFISYSRQDSQSVDGLVQELEAAAVETWIDRGSIQVGAKWRRTLVDAIEGASAVVVVLSPSSVASDNVRKELDIAEDANKPVLPVEIQHTAIPNDLRYHLVGLQRIDLTADFELGVRRLIDAVRKLHPSPKSVADQPAPNIFGDDALTVERYMELYLPKTDGEKT